MTPDDRIAALDPDLFAAIPTQTSPEDRRSLLILQRVIRRKGPYSYLEIGSHVGGTIQPYYVDPLCRLIYSIDKRPSAQPDERGRFYDYPHNSSARMLANLTAAFPSQDVGKVIVFDSDARDVRRDAIAMKPLLCLIDGEHTSSAVLSDLAFCLRVADADALIALHDAGYVQKGIASIERQFVANDIVFRSFLLPDSVYVIALRDAIHTHGRELEPHARDAATYFRTQRRLLRRERLKNLLRQRPLLARGAAAIRALLTR